jgi:hypothetical protein
MSTPFTTDDSKQMLKEILASTTDLQKRMVAQEDMLGTLSGEVASLKADQGRLHVAVNKVQPSQLNNAAKNDRSVGATEDEPRNEGSSQAGGMAVPSSMRPPTNFASPSMTTPRIPCRG